MGFTLGGLAELHDPEVRLMIGPDADGHVAGVASNCSCPPSGATAGADLPDATAAGILSPARIPASIR